MFFNFKLCLTTCSCTWIFTEPNNCYRWFHMISGHRTEKLLSMGFEILALVSCTTQLVDYSPGPGCSNIG